MSTRKSKGLFGAFAIAFVVLCLAGLIGFKSGTISLPGFINDSGSLVELSPVVTIKGVVKARHLNLSQKEIKRINSCVFKHRNLLEGLDMKLNLAEKEAPLDDIRSDTRLKMVMGFRSDDCEVTSWEKSLTRKDLVRQMVRFMDKAAEEYEHYSNLPGKKKKISKMYI